MAENEKSREQMAKEKRQRDNMNKLWKFAGASVTYRDFQKNPNDLNTLWSGARYHYNRILKCQDPVYNTTINIAEEYANDQMRHEQMVQFYKQQQEALKKDPNAIEKDKRMENPGEFQPNKYGERAVQSIIRGMETYHNDRERARAETSVGKLFDWYTNKKMPKEISGDLQKLIRSTKNTFGGLMEEVQKGKNQKGVLVANSLYFLDEEKLAWERLNIEKAETGRKLAGMSADLEGMLEEEKKNK